MKNKKEIGKKGEELFIKTINSGAFYQKGDAISNEHCIEIKTTTNKSFRLSTNLLKKIYEEAFDQNKFPMFGVVIEQPNEQWILKINIIKKQK